MRERGRERGEGEVFRVSEREKGKMGERERSSEKRGKGESNLVIVVLHREEREGSFTWGLRWREEGGGKRVV